MVHMGLTPQCCSNRQTEGNRKYEHGHDYLDSHVLADLSVMTHNHAPTLLLIRMLGMYSI